jgi:hypothetical protein
MRWSVRAMRRTLSQASHPPAPGSRHQCDHVRTCPAARGLSYSLRCWGLCLFQPCDVSCTSTWQAKPVPAQLPSPAPSMSPSLCPGERLTVSMVAEPGPPNGVSMGNTLGKIVFVAFGSPSVTLLQEEKASDPSNGRDTANCIWATRPYITQAQDAPAAPRLGCTEILRPLAWLPLHCVASEDALRSSLGGCHAQSFPVRMAARRGSVVSLCSLSVPEVPQSATDELDSKGDRRLYEL